MSNAGGFSPSGGTTFSQRCNARAATFVARKPRHVCVLGEACVGGVIYLMRQNGELVEMNERGYDTEDLLQGYLADHPDLLAGDQIDEDEPRR